MVNDSLERLRVAYPWPLQKPEIPVGANRASGFDGCPFYLIRCNLNSDVHLVVELGSWLGKSAKFTLDNASNATVICIDHWNGSPEHQEAYADMLPTLYESFLHDCWEYRDRIIPIRANTLDGLKIVYDCGLSPNLIYIDASHEYDDVKSDLVFSHKLFPDAVIIGDDYKNIRGVRHAVNHFMYENGFSVQIHGNGYQILKNRKPVLQRHLEEQRA